MLHSTEKINSNFLLSKLSVSPSLCLGLFFSAQSLHSSTNLNMVSELLCSRMNWSKLPQSNPSMDNKKSKTKLLKKTRRSCCYFFFFSVWSFAASFQAKDEDDHLWCFLLSSSCCCYGSIYHLPCQIKVRLLFIRFSEILIVIFFSSSSSDRPLCLSIQFVF